MFKHILIPTDGSTLSAKAIKGGIKLAVSMDARITLYRATDEDSGIYAGEGYAVPRELRMRAAREVRSRIEAELGEARSAATAAGVACDWIIGRTYQPWRGIIDAAKKRKCDLIVMASHGHGGLKGMLIGSETQKVLTHCRIPVLVCR